MTNQIHTYNPCSKCGKEVSDIKVVNDILYCDDCLPKGNIWKDSKVELPKEYILIDGTIEVVCVMHDEYIIDTPYFGKMNTFNLPNGYYEEDIIKWCYKKDLIKQSQGE